MQPWNCHHEEPTVEIVLCVCCVCLCVWREPIVSRLSDYLNNLSSLSLNPRWGCSSGTQQDKSASGASFPVIYGTPLWPWWSTILQVSDSLKHLNVLTFTFFYCQHVWPGLVSVSLTVRHCDRWIPWPESRVSISQVGCIGESDETCHRRTTNYAWKNKLVLVKSYFVFLSLSIEDKNHFVVFSQGKSKGIWRVTALQHPLQSTSSSLLLV